MMSLLAAILWCFMSGGALVCPNPPLDYGLNTKPHIQHMWYDPNDPRQEIVQRAYELGWLDFVTLIECENGNRNPKAVWDNGKAFWLCQMNVNYHKLPQEYYDDAYFQLDYCFAKRKTWTRFYWPSRIIKWKKCYNYVSDRFILDS